MIERIRNFFRGFLRKDNIVRLDIGGENDNLAELGCGYCNDVC